MNEGACRFSPQLGVSWERTGRRREEGQLVPGSNSSALMVHPTLSKTFHGSLQTFLVVSLPGGATKRRRGVAKVPDSGWDGMGVLKPDVTAFPQYPTAPVSPVQPRM